MPPSIRVGPVRARDLRANIAELGFERGVTTTLELMLEEHQALRQNMREMTELLNTMSNNLINMVHVAEHAKKRIEEIERLRDQGDVIEHGND